jgi:catechol 2,3-dioxygenase-like lactoylglutathione lyase family enzyme
MKISLAYAIEYVADMDAAVQFYCERLGLKLKNLSDNWTEFETGPTTLALHLTDDPGRIGKVELGFHTPEIDSVYANLSSRGIVFTKKPEPLHGVKLASFINAEGAQCSLSGR